MKSGVRKKGGGKESCWSHIKAWKQIKPQTLLLFFPSPIFPSISKKLCLSLQDECFHWFIGLLKESMCAAQSAVLLMTNNELDGLVVISL